LTIITNLSRKSWLKKHNLHNNHIHNEQTKTVRQNTIQVTHKFCQIYKMNFMWEIFRCWKAAESDIILKANMNRIMLWNTSVNSNNDSRRTPTFIKHDKATTYQALSCDVMPRCLVHRYHYLGKPAASTMLMETAHSPEITYLPTTCHPRRQ